MKDQGGTTMRWILIGVGIVLILLGGLSTLQGVGLLTGSVMAGQTFWAIAGVVLLIAGRPQKESRPHLAYFITQVYCYQHIMPLGTRGVHLTYTQENFN